MQFAAHSEAIARCQCWALRNNVLISQPESADSTSRSFEHPLSCSSQRCFSRIHFVFRFTFFFCTGRGCAMQEGSSLRSAPGADRSGHGDAEPAGSSHRPLSACACSPEVTVTSYSPTPFVSPRGIFNTNQRTPSAAGAGGSQRWQHAQEGVGIRESQRQKSKARVHFLSD